MSDGFTESGVFQPAEISLSHAIMGNEGAVGEYELQDAVADETSATCTSCESDAYRELYDEPLCRDCYYEELYTVSETEGPRTPPLEDVLTDDSSITLDDFCTLYKTTTSNSPRFRVHFTRPLKVSGLEQGDYVEVALDPEQRPPMFVLGAIPDAENADDLPTSRKISSGDVADVTIPPKLVYEDRNLGIDPEAYSNENKLYLWPQVMEDAVFLFVYPFEAEMEKFRKEFEAERAAEEFDADQDSNADLEDTEPRDDSTPEQEPVEEADEPAVEDAAQISQSTVETTIDETGVDAADLPAALERVATLETTQVDELTSHGPFGTDAATVYPVPESFWAADGPLATFDLPHDVREACRYAHDLEAVSISDDVDGDYERLRVAYDAIVLPAE